MLMHDGMESVARFKNMEDMLETLRVMDVERIPDVGTFVQGTMVVDERPIEVFVVHRRVLRAWGFKYKRKTRRWYGRVREDSSFYS